MFAGVVLVIANAFRPLPEPVVSMAKPPSVSAVAPNLAWPVGGQAAVGAEGYGVLATFGNQQPIATASIAKVLTALCVLEKHPLKVGEKGEVITITEADYALYKMHRDNGGSFLPVYVGQQISEYEAIQALMIPSANNLADTLAAWAFGSIEGYRAYATDFLKRHGLVQTTIGTDASGLDVGTRSTAEDLIRLGMYALKNPVLMEVVGQKSADFSTGTQQNYNKTLGTFGINGIKTGNNTENGGGLLFSKNISISGQTVRAIGVVLGANDLDQALDSSARLASSMDTVFQSVTVLHKGSTVGKVQTEWSTSADVQAAANSTIVRYVGNNIHSSYTVLPLEIASQNDFGTAELTSGTRHQSVKLKLDKKIEGPSWWWRAKRTL